MQLQSAMSVKKDENSFSTINQQTNNETSRSFFDPLCQLVSYVANKVFYFFQSAYQTLINGFNYFFNTEAGKSRVSVIGDETIEEEITGTTRTDSSLPLTGIAKKIDDYKQDYLNKIAKEKSKLFDPQSIFDTDLEKFHDVTESEIVEKLEKCLESKETYYQSMEELAFYLQAALYQSSQSKTSNISKTVVDSVSNYYQNVLGEEEFSSFKDFRDFTKENCDTAFYALQRDDTEEEKLQGRFNQCQKAIFFLLKLNNIQTNLKQNSIDANELHSKNEFKKYTLNEIKHAFSYLSLLWLHGSKASTIKSAAEKTENNLVPTGVLRKKGVTPLSGELLEGAQAVGINNRSLSGVSLGDVRGCIKYADSFIMDIDSEKTSFTDNQKSVTKMLSTVTRITWSQLVMYSPKVSSLAISLQRLKSLDHDFFESVKGDLFQMVQDYKELLDGIIFKPHLKNIYNWHDNYYSSRFYSVLESLETIEKILLEDAHQEYDEEDLELSQIETVFASFTRFGCPVNLQNYPEHFEENIFGNIELGKDLQVVFVEQENIQRVEELLKKYGLEDMKVESKKTLEIAGKIAERKFYPTEF